MGKSNRIRSEKAQKTIDTSSLRTTGKNNKKSTPSWLYSLLISIVALFVVVMIVVTAVSSSGIVMRSRKAIYSDDYTINGSILQYMFMGEYQQFLTDNESYLNYFSLDTSKSLKSQKYGDTSAGTGYETSFLGAFEGSWYDYFMSKTEEQARQLLIYCEEADERGIKLEDSDYAEIDAALAQLELTASLYGYSANAYIAQMYGEGVKVKDIRKAMEISALATKCAVEVDEDLIAGITDDEISAKYNENVRDYNVVDYVYYTFSVDFDDLAKDVIDGYDGKTELTADQEAKVLEVYKEKIAEAKANAAKFEALADVDVFLSTALRTAAEKAFDELYKSEALADADKLSDDALAAVKTAMVDKVLEEVKAEAAETSDDTAEADGKFTAYGQTVTENAAKAIDEIKSDLFAEVEYTNEACVVDKLKFDKDDQVSKWAFDEAKAVGETKVITLGDGSDDNADIKNEDGYFDASVYMLKTKEYCDKTLAKNVAYMTFSTEDAAKKAIESFKTSATLDKAAFESVATANAAVTNGTFENYLEGQISYMGFEDWLYGEKTAVGSYTEAPLANAATEATEYAVFFYFEDGDEAWYIDVKNAIYVSDYEANLEAMTAKYAVTVKESALSKIDA